MVFEKQSTAWLTCQQLMFWFCMSVPVQRQEADKGRQHAINAYSCSLRFVFKHSILLVVCVDFLILRNDEINTNCNQF